MSSPGRLDILYIDHYAGSLEYGMEYRPYYLAREWSRHGHRVTVVAASYSHVRNRQPLLSGGITRETIDGIKYIWCATPAYRGNGLGRIVNMLHFLKHLGQWQRWLRTEPDIVIASSTYPLDIFSARKIARRFEASLVWEIHDLWPLTPMELGGMSKWHPFIQVMQFAEDYACRHCDAAVSLLSNASNHLVSHGLRPDKFHYIPNGIDPDEWSAESVLPASVAETLRCVGGRGRPIVGYAGGHGLSNALDMLLDAAALLRGVVEIVMVGNGPERERLLRRVDDQGLSNVTMIPAIPKRAVPAFLRSIDIAYMGMKPEPLYRFGISPNKIFDYMMAGKPIVLAADVGGDPVTAAGCGVTTQPENAGAISAAIASLASRGPQELAEIGNHGRKFVLEHRSYEVLARRFLEVCRTGGAR